MKLLSWIYLTAALSIFYAIPTFACTSLVQISHSSPNYNAASRVAENIMTNFKAAGLAQKRSYKADRDNVQIFCFKATSSDYVDLIRAHLKAVMADYSGVSVDGVSGKTPSPNGALTCQSSQVRQAIRSCFSRRPNCPLSEYCSWAYGWYEQCSTRRPNRYCRH